MISSLQVFDLIFVMIGNTSALVGPLRTIVYGVYESGFMFSQMGYASAQAFILFLLILFMTIVQFAGQKKMGSLRGVKEEVIYDEEGLDTRFTHLWGNYNDDSFYMDDFHFTEDIR